MFFNLMIVLFVGILNEEYLFCIRNKHVDNDDRTY